MNTVRGSMHVHLPLAQIGFLGASPGASHTVIAVDWVSPGDAPPNGEEDEPRRDDGGEVLRGEERRAYGLDIHSTGS